MNGCSSKAPIDEINSHPRDYIDKVVTVEGKVNEVFSFTFINYFEISDETGKIKIITTKPLPAKGEILSITGTVQNYSIGFERLLVIVEEDETE